MTWDVFGICSTARSILNHPLIDLLKKTNLTIHSSQINNDQLNIVIQIRAKPGAKKSRIEIGDQGELILAFSKRPIEGAANKEIIKILSRIFGVSASQIFLDKGKKSKQKLFIVSFLFTDHKSIDYYLAKISKELIKIEDSHH